MNIDIKHIAKLARLRIEDDQLDKFESEMQNIVGMVEKLPDSEKTWLFRINSQDRSLCRTLLR